MFVFQMARGAVVIAFLAICQVNTIASVRRNIPVPNYDIIHVHVYKLTFKTKMFWRTKRGNRDFGPNWTNIF